MKQKVIAARNARLAAKKKMQEQETDRKATYFKVKKDSESTINQSRKESLSSTMTRPVICIEQVTDLNKGRLQFTEESS